MDPVDFIGLIQEGKNNPHKKRKKLRFMIGSAGCSLLRATGFSCSLHVLHRGLEGLGISKLQFYDQFFGQFLPFLIIKSLDSEQDPDLDPEPDLH
jgi:hypothetical protein